MLTLSIQDLCVSFFANHTIFPSIYHYRLFLLHKLFLSFPLHSFTINTTFTNIFIYGDQTNLPYFFVTSACSQLSSSTELYFSLLWATNHQNKYQPKCFFGTFSPVSWAFLVSTQPQFVCVMTIYHRMMFILSSHCLHLCSGEHW